MTLHAGDRLGAYEILAPLGSGGMGEVWRARDTRLKRDVAIKVLPDALAADVVARARFDREARAVAALSHPNILDLHDVGSEGGTVWAVMELLQGQTLKARLEEGALAWRRAAEIALALADGLAAAHALGIIHRDLKPSNVFLTADGRVKILDFGIAMFDDTSGLASGSRDLTEPQGIVGTAGYLAPEQIRREGSDARSDIFALGCVLYEMVTGRRAFPGETAPEALVATLRGEPDDPADLVPGLPPDMRLIILRCLEKKADRRFQSAADLAFALRAPIASTGNPPSFVSATEPTAALPASIPSRRRARAAPVAAGATALAAVAAWLVFSRAAPPAPDVLVVLPFVNETGDSGNEYLSEGVTASLIDALSKAPRLSVLARATVYAVAPRNPDPRAAGRTLGARTVVTGRVRRHGRDLLVDAELVDVASGAHLWAGRITDREGDPTPAAVDLAPQIARALRPAMTAEEEKRVASRAHDPQAWDRVQRGRFFLNKRSEDGFLKALGYFQDAARLDPREAEAWRGLADVHHLLAYYGFSAPAELVPKQREFADHAVTLDPTLSGAHALLADARYLYERDWPGAEEEFRRALSLNPNDAVAHQWYSNFLTASGRFEESFQEIGRARALDPLNWVIQMDAGLAHHWAGDEGVAVAEIRRAIEMDPLSPFPHLFIALPLLAEDRAADALAELRKLPPDLPEAIAFSGYASARLGREADVQAARRDLEAVSKARYVSGLPFAILALGQRRVPEALDGLEQALAQGEPKLMYLEVERAFDPLRGEPRFREVVRRLGIPKRR